MGKLYRSGKGVIGGVCAGLAKEFGLDVKLTRIVAVILFFLSASLVFWVYIFLWILLPVEKPSEGYAERMKEKLANREGAPKE